jgi:hypothetical protein
VRRLLKRSEREKNEKRKKLKGMFKTRDRKEEKAEVVRTGTAAS